MTVAIEQQFINKKITDENGIEYFKWVVATPKSKTGYRTIPVGRILMEILKKAKKKQIENRLKYGEFYLQDPDHDFVCKKENGEHYTPAVIKYQTRALIRKS